MSEIKVLTVKQPWATAILELGKDVENRIWSTDYIGRLYIHSSKKHEELEYINCERILSKVSPVAARMELSRCKTFRQNGYILGFVDLIDVTTNSNSEWAIKGQYHWLLANPILLDNPICCKGQLGLWTPEFHHNIYVAENGQIKVIGDEWDDYGFDYRPEK